MSAMTTIRFDMATGPTETEAVRGCNLVNMHGCLHLLQSQDFLKRVMK